MTKKIHAALVVGPFVPTLVVAALYCCIGGSFPNYAASAFTTTTTMTPSSTSSTTSNYAKYLPKSSPSPSSPQFQFPTTTTTATTTSSLKMAMEEEMNFYEDDDNNYEDDDDTIDYIDDDDESDDDLDDIVLDLEVEEDIVVEAATEAAAETATATATETKTTAKASETSWSELFSEAAGAAVLLGGKAAKAAAEKVGELKTDDLPSLPTDLAANVPKSLKDAASQASNLGVVAAKVVSTATEAASDAIGGITTAVPGSSTILKRSKNADVAVPYDSAARLAYEEWQVEFKNKIPRPFENDDEDDEEEQERPTYTSEERFQFFQERYVNATIQNVALKKQLREAPPPPPPPAPIEDENGTVTAAAVADDSSSVPSFIVLDQYADLSPEEYTKVMKSLEPKSWSDILGEIATLAGTAAASTAEIISSTTTDKPTIKVASSAAAKKKKDSSSPKAPSFSIFSSNRNGPKGSTAATSSTLKKKKVTKTYSPVVPTKPTSSMFGGILSPKKTEDSKSSKTKKTAVKTPKKYSKASKKNEVSRSSLSLFAPKPKQVESKQPTAPAPTRSTFSIFGSPKPASKTATKKSATKVAAKKKTAVVAKSSTPTLSNWVQNDDGSLTGKVSNSKNYRNGTKITTSPVRKGVKKGSVVKTGSGSQYKLM